MAVAARNARRLLTLVNTLLDFSRIEAGRLRAAFEPTDLAALTADIASVFRSAAERAELEQLLRADPLPVLEVLRYETEALLLRTRIVTDAVREARGAATQGAAR